ncbi:MAG: flagellar M-ring protein FliF [Firmicutes bacterium]|nr:flagellar M-ring protein FliF [Bacillota bacterium]
MSWELVLERIRESIKRHGGRRFAVAAAALLLLPFAAVWGLRAAAEPDLATLYANLDMRDASEVAVWLEGAGIPYTVADDGRSIKVASARVHQVRLNLAAEGLPRDGGPGYELLDRSGFGLTDFDRRVNRVRALQGELERTIGQINGVDSARVHIVLPEETVFVRERKPSTASVFVRMKGFGFLQPDQVQGIVHLVSGSVEGLSADGVTVVDSRGRVLAGDSDLFAGVDTGTASAGIGAGGARGSQAWLALNLEFENRLESRLQTLLEQVVGPGNVSTRVSAELDPELKEIERVTYEPGDGGTEGILRSTREYKEAYRGLPGGSVGGIPGTWANAGTDAEPGAAGGAGMLNGGEPSNWEKVEKVNNYEVNQVREKILVAPGSTRRLTVAVAVNKPLSPEEESSLMALVSAAIGFDPKRDDVVTVTSLPFNSDLAEVMKDDLARREAADARRRILAWGAAGSGALLAAVAAIVLLLRRRGRRAAAGAAGDAGGMKGGGGELIPFPLTAASGEAGRLRLRQNLQEVAREKPGQVANLIKTWLAEDR